MRAKCPKREPETTTASESETLKVSKAPWQGGDLRCQVAAILAHNTGAIRPRFENLPVIPLQMVSLPTLHECPWLRELHDHLLLLAVIAVHGSQEPVAELSLELLLLLRLQFCQQLFELLAWQVWSPMKF